MNKYYLLISITFFSFFSISQITHAKNSNSHRQCNKDISSLISAAENLSFELEIEIDPITPGFAILEGPIWIDGSLVMSHIGYSVDGVNPSNRVALRDGEITVLQESYLSNGMTINHLGHVVAARHFDGSITGVENARIYANSYEGNRFNSPNDLVFSSDGDLYFSDPDYQAPVNGEILQTAERTYHVTANGQISSFGEDVIMKPNGVMLSKNERTLYVGGTNGLFKFELNRDGSVIDSPEQILAEEIPEGVDGMSRDNCGNLFVAAAGEIKIISSREEFVAGIEIPGITNIAFGGDSGREIFATTLGGTPAVYRANTQWLYKGLPY